MEEKKEKNIIKINKTILIIIAIIIPIAFILLGMFIGGEISLLNNNTDKDCVNTKKESKTTTDEITFKDTVSNKTFTIYNTKSDSGFSTKDETGKIAGCEWDGSNSTIHVCYNEDTLNNNYVLIYNYNNDNYEDKYIYDIKNEKLIYKFGNVEAKYSDYFVRDFKKNVDFYVVTLSQANSEPSIDLIYNSNFALIASTRDYYIDKTEIYYIERENNKTSLIEKNLNNTVMYADRTNTTKYIKISSNYVLYIENNYMMFKDLTKEDVVNTKVVLKDDIYDFYIENGITHILYFDKDAAKESEFSKKVNEYRLEQGGTDFVLTDDDFKNDCGYELKYNYEGKFISKEVRIFERFGE